MSKTTYTIVKEFHEEDGIPMVKITLHEDDALFYEETCPVKVLEGADGFWLKRLDDWMRDWKDPVLIARREEKRRNRKPITKEEYMADELFMELWPTARFDDSGNLIGYD